MAYGDTTRDPLLRTFGRVLRLHREAAGLTRPQLAAALGCGYQWIEKLETAQRAPSEPTAIDFDTYFETPGTFHAMWLEIRRTGRYAELPPGFTGFLDIETKASAMWIFELAVVTGLFQTRRYAYEVLKNGRKPAIVERLVDKRIKRAEILEREDPPEITLVIEERALHLEMDPAIQKEQIEHLIELAERYNITVQIVPSNVGSYPGILGAFTILEYVEEPGGGTAQAVYVEGHAEGQLTDVPDVVKAHTMGFGQIRAAALSAGESLKLLHTLRENYAHP
ncbi:helix-turn-helix domain-containing protein [Actinocorallia sp. API 0066]|uniref:helix-turn-helix domain-containing protein n=1 Tax=Actinocorallia sp. API 0066 TaxID=2896846 RepID=UPI001E3C57C2|nr:helix-turn-helix transcriptional regulator [Actinocorallia sp. API 0066]MCD0448136.1 helix-turn-helix domain-containing protein [Actinocorallia sp. API 0066]